VCADTEAVEGLSAVLFTRVLGWSKEELDVLLSGARSEHRDTKIHSYYEYYVSVSFFLFHHSP
jgi:hypothetical protein